MADLLIYGSYGYTGDLIAREAADRETDPILAGRNPGELLPQANDLDLRGRAFEADEAADELHDVDAVLNCAGPFSRTADGLAEACIETGTHYLDITAEIPVFERLARRGGDAEAAGVTLLPGVGFDVVPTDCLAAHLVERLPDATHLSLAVEAGGSLSPGTLKTMLAGVGDGGAVRESGRLRVLERPRAREIDFGEGARGTVSVPWGDVSTASHTTGVPNVEVYAALPESARKLLGARARRSLEAALGVGPVRSLLERAIDRYVEGPSARQRERGRALLWGEARVESDDGGDGASENDGGTADDRRAVSRLRTPETYALTVETALLIAGRVLDGEAPTGFATPAGAFGPDLILDVDGVERTDE